MVSVDDAVGDLVSLDDRDYSRVTTCCSCRFVIVRQCTLNR